ncbi:transposase [Streptomyces sp. NPDC001774]
MFQRAENLTDRQAAEAVRDRLSWMNALGLGPQDTGFGFTVLSQFRTRVAGRTLEEKVLDLLLARLQADGLLKASGKQRAHATHVISAVRDLNRAEMAGESVRAAAEALTVAAPHWPAACWTCLAGRAATTPGPTPGACHRPGPGATSSPWPS